MPIAGVHGKMKKCGNCIHSIRTMRIVRTPFDSEYDAFGIPSSVVQCKKVQWRCLRVPGKTKDVEESHLCDCHMMDSLQEFLEPDVDKVISKKGAS